MLLLVLGACKNPEVENLPGPGFTGSDLPFITFTTDGLEIPDEPKIPGRISAFEGDNELFSSNMGIELRGSTSRRLFPKKSFGIELKEVNGEDKDLDLFAFGEEEDWVLYGPYSDKTFMRNSLIYELSNQIGAYAPQTKFVEASYENDYLGVYVFMERIKRDISRVQIEPLNAAVIDASAITGGYIIKIDKTSGDTGNSDWEGDAIYTENLGFRSDFGAYGNKLSYPPYSAKRGEETYFMYHYPRREDITDIQKQYISNYISDFEEALVEEDFSSSERAYANYIDVNSFADYFILNELSANPDGYRLSTYMHKDRDSKLKMGPIWDFNLAFGNDGRSQTNTWIYQYNRNNPGDLWLIHFWWTKLLADPYFRSVVKERWQMHSSGALSIGNMNSLIDGWKGYLEENGAIERNYDRWPVMGEQLPFNSYVGQSYSDEVEYVKNWLSARHQWMSSEISKW